LNLILHSFQATSPARSTWDAAYCYRCRT